MAAVVWGRSVFDNIRKFLTFQLTVNVVALFLSLIGAITNYPLPLTTVQLLWINLIMDTAAAVALGTEQPIAEELLSRSPKSPNIPLISKAMWYKILSQASYQLAILLFILYKADALPLGLPDTDPLVPKSTKHKTLVFNTFVWLQLANIFNNRKVDPEYAIFTRIYLNAYFAAIVLCAMGIQVMMVELFGAFANTESQTGEMWGWALLLGFGSIPMHYVYTPVWKFLTKSFPRLLEQDEVHASAFEGAHLDDHRYSFKRPDEASRENSVMGSRKTRLKSHSSFTHPGLPMLQDHSHVGLGAALPMVVTAGSNAASANARLISSMSARRAASSSAARRSATNVSFQPVHGDSHKLQPHGDLEAVSAAPLSSAQLAASASWPRSVLGPDGRPTQQGEAQKPLGSHKTAGTGSGGVQVIEELDELI